jgi:S1-C subfamily serine protease
MAAYDDEDMAVDDDALDNDVEETTAPPAPTKKQKRSTSTHSNSNKTKVQFHLQSVVKLYVKKVLPSQSGPWKMGSESASTGTGFILENNRLLTNAHVVHRAQSILCRPQSGSRKYECQIESISLPLDLAVLTVKSDNDGDEEDGEDEDENGNKTNSFFKDKRPLFLVQAGFEHLPHLDDNVTAVGFPTGGDQISVTRGVVSRITLDGSIGQVLRVQIDAAINP